MTYKVAFTQGTTFFHKLQYILHYFFNNKRNVTKNLFAYMLGESI